MTRSLNYGYGRMIDGGDSKRIMEIVIMGIGKTSVRYIEEGIQEYNNRICHYIPLKLLWLRDIKGGGKIPIQRQKDIEGEMFLQQLKPGDRVILLDEKGREYTSREYATWYEKQMNSGFKRLIFIIGGPYGFSDALYQRCDHKISFSKMTFNHEMIRLFLIEQLYRAHTILRGEPYHHD